VSFHEEKGSEATMVLKSVENPLDFGIVILEEDGRISRFLEKPAWGQVFSDTVNTGIYLLEPSVMGEIPEEGEYDFSKELFPKLLEAGRPMYGYVTEDYWEDIGTLGAVRRGAEGRARRAGKGREAPGYAPQGEHLRRPADAGRRRGARGAGRDRGERPYRPGRQDQPLHRHSGQRRRLGGGTIERSIVADGTYIGEGAELKDTLVGRNSYVQARARILERSAWGTT
jgi:mannose-1-phosphate guanylyltransferase/phosphomannomutase